MTNLKPCPFCGGEAYIEEESDSFSTVQYVARCKNCLAEVRIGADMTKSFEYNRQKVTEVWNNRHSPWQTGTPTELEENEYWAWNYVLVLNTTYDCIGNYLAGLLFKPDFERRLFSAPTDGGKHIEIPFSEVVAWQRIEPYEEKENGHTD